MMLTDQALQSLRNLGNEAEEAADEITELRTALRQVASAHAWLAFGECRAFSSALTLLSPSEADAVARAALGECSADDDPEQNK